MTVENAGRLPSKGWACRYPQGCALGTWISQLIHEAPAPKETEAPPIFDGQFDKLTCLERTRCERKRQRRSSIPFMKFAALKGDHEIAKFRVDRVREEHAGQFSSLPEEDWIQMKTAANF